MKFLNVIIRLRIQNNVDLRNNDYKQYYSNVQSKRVQFLPNTRKQYKLQLSTHATHSR